MGLNNDDRTDAPSLTSVLKSGNSQDEESLEETLQDCDDTGSLLEGEYVTEDDKLCVACHVPVFTEAQQEEIAGSYLDFKKAVYQVSTPWIMHNDELNSGNGQLCSQDYVSLDEEPLEETRQDCDDIGSLLEGEYVTDDYKLCVACHVPVFTEAQEEVAGSYLDFQRTVHQVSTSWIIRDDELDKIAGSIREANLTPEFDQDVPRVILLKDGLKIGSKRINVYV